MHYVHLSAERHPAQREYGNLRGSESMQQEKAIIFLKRIIATLYSHNPL